MERYVSNDILIATIISNFLKSRHYANFTSCINLLVRVHCFQYELIYSYHFGVHWLSSVHSFYYPPPQLKSWEFIWSRKSYAYALPEVWCVKISFCRHSTTETSPFGCSKMSTLMSYIKNSILIYYEPERKHIQSKGWRKSINQSVVERDPPFMAEAPNRVNFFDVGK